MNFGRVAAVGFATVILAGRCASALQCRNAASAADTQVAAEDISLSTTYLVPVTFTVSAPTTVLVIASIRWFPTNAQTATGHRVARINVDGADIPGGPLMIAHAVPGGLDQFSTGATYPVTLSAGTHTIRVHFGTCCGPATPFVVGNMSRLDVVWN